MIYKLKRGYSTLIISINIIYKCRSNWMNEFHCYFAVIYSSRDWCATWGNFVVFFVFKIPVKLISVLVIWSLVTISINKKLNSVYLIFLSQSKHAYNKHIPSTYLRYCNNNVDNYRHYWYKLFLLLLFFTWKNLKIIIYCHCTGLNNKI